MTPMILVQGFDKYGGGTETTVQTLAQKNIAVNVLKSNNDIEHIVVHFKHGLTENFGRNRKRGIWWEYSNYKSVRR